MNDNNVPRLIKLDSKERYRRLFSVKEGSAIALRSGQVVLNEGENIGEHSTGGSEEMLVILEGRGELIIKSGVMGFEKGTSLYIPPDTVHDVRNAGPGALKYIFVTSPVGANEKP